MSAEIALEEIHRKALPLERREPLVAHLKDRRVVMLGESTHGTAEFYSIRRTLTEILVRDHGFSFVAAEADWPTSSLVRERDFERVHRWPTWMWANEEISRLSAFLGPRGVPFYGLDLYSLFESMDAVLSFARERDPFLAAQLAQRYACFEPYHRDEIAYAKSLLIYPSGCREEILSALGEMLRFRARGGGDPELFEALQNAHAAASAERFYRAMIQGDEESWNIRDHHMLDTLKRLLERHGPDSKCVVWAHNTHVGDYRATDMVTEGYVNLGGLARETFGSQKVALVGFATHSGEVTAASAWAGEERVVRVPHAVSPSIEALFHRVSLERSMPGCYLVFGDDDRLGPLSRTLGHRAIGVVYDPAHETTHNYVPTALSVRYDAFVHVDRTSALESLHARARKGLFPETWPVGA